MIKIKSLFVCNYPARDVCEITREVTPGLEWVLAGEGRAYRKWDGTACLFKDGMLYKRFDAKHGKKAPDGFTPCQDPDPVTQHWPGWVPVNVDNPDPSDVWIALSWWMSAPVDDGTYEAVGPRINNNKECLHSYSLLRHDNTEILDLPGRDFDSLRSYLEHAHMEGIVFWREPGNPSAGMAKIRRDHFGFDWPVKR